MPIVDAYLTGEFEWWDLTKNDVLHMNLVGQEVHGDSGTVVIAKADPSHYPPWISSAHVTQYGECCGQGIASWAKRAICPECEEQVYLT